MPHEWGHGSLKGYSTGGGSGIQAADAAGFGDTRDAEHIGGQAHIDLLVGVDLEHIGEGPGHDLLQFRVDVLLIPEEVVFVLHPFEVADGDATGVAEDVGDQEYALLVEDAVGFRGDRAVGDRKSTRLNSSHL